jgi:bifunctional non-homologous end joining protein LigD
VTISHPDKVLFPQDGINKGELAAYYEAVAAIMLPQIRGRPVTMERFPSGLGGGGFLQKDVSKGFPEWLERVEVPKKGGTVHYPLANDERSLLWMANQNCVTLHVWTSRLPELFGRIRPRRSSRIAAARAARRARVAELGQDVRLQGIPHRCAA